MLALLGLLQPWPYKILIDYVFGRVPAPEAGLMKILLSPFAGDPRVSLVYVLMLIIGLVLVSEVVSWAQSFALFIVSQKVLFRATSDLFAKMERLSLVFFSNQLIGDYVYRLTNDITAISGLISSFLIPLLTSVFAFVGMFAVMASFNITLALIALVFVPFSFAVLFLFMPRMQRQARAIQEKESGLFSYLEQVLSELKVVQAFTQESLEFKQFQGKLQEALRVNRNFEITGNLFSFSQMAVVAAATVAVLMGGSALVFGGSLTVGSLIVFMNYLSSLYGQVVRMSGAAGSYKTTRAKLDRVFEVLNARDVIDESHGHLSARQALGSVEFSNVSFSIPSKFLGSSSGEEMEVLRDVNLKVMPGAKVAIVGKSGAGKTSLTSLIPRFFDPSRGEVLLDGRPLSLYELQSLRQAIAIVPQEPILFNTSIRDNIAYGNLHAGDEEIQEAAKAASADQFIKELPGGYTFVVGEKGVKLSGGQRQRIVLARAFLKRARIFILDEPTAALDSYAQEKIYEALTNLTKGKTTFVIAHSIPTVHSADMIVVMDGGRVVATGRHEELIKSCARYQELYRETMWSL